MRRILFASLVLASALTLQGAPAWAQGACPANAPCMPNAGGGHGHGTMLIPPPGHGSGGNHGNYANNGWRGHGNYPTNNWRGNGNWNNGNWNNGAAVAGGFAAGALLGGALAAPAPYYNAPPPDYAGDAVDATVGSDPVAYCQARFRSYDPNSGTYLGYDGLRHPCP